ncbi:MAG: response regulator transcription factor [Gammaproteobacteria bacterium]|nr:response regulator transcription factor [Gammaproteobacteria bacterium]
MKANRLNILIIDDEPQIQRFLRIALEAQNYAVVTADTGREGLVVCASEAPDLVLLDLGLPDMDGQSVIKELRSWSQVPVIVLSVRSSDAEKIQALDAGANDYVTKPFSVAEVSARIRALMRTHATLPAAQPVLSCGDLSLDISRREALLNHVPLKLSRKEFDLLQMLMTHAGRVLTHGYILKNIWGPTHEDDVQYLRVYIGQLRAKLNDDPTQPRYIANELGVGYRMIDNA